MDVVERSREAQKLLTDQLRCSYHSATADLDEFHLQETFVVCNVIDKKGSRMSGVSSLWCVFVDRCYMTEIFKWFMELNFLRRKHHFFIVPWRCRFIFIGGVKKGDWKGSLFAVKTQEYWPGKSVWRWNNVPDGLEVHQKR